MAAFRVLGIDPGTRVTGWAVLEAAGDGGRRLDSGVLRLDGGAPSPAERLLRLRRGLREVVGDWRPSLLALEAAFFGRNARSALRLGEARGVVMVTAAEHGVPVLELPPAQVKRRVSGAGRATKEQIARLVCLQLGLPDGTARADEADALAVALCALLERRFGVAGTGGP